MEGILVNVEHNNGQEGILLGDIQYSCSGFFYRSTIVTLLDDKRMAQRLISELPEKDRKEIMGFTIYSLL